MAGENELGDFLAAGSRSQRQRLAGWSEDFVSDPLLRPFLLDVSGTGRQRMVAEGIELNDFVS